LKTDINPGQKYTSKKPIITLPTRDKDTKSELFSATGQSFVIHEWQGSGPDYLHVHYEDDEAWHILEGTLTFKFTDSIVDAPKGTTVFVPAGVPHTYYANGFARYLIILTPGLNELISELQASPYDQHATIMKKYKSEILE
jgi:mannose-6-phosphate isomerase-like protein (cupin superfamily)